MRLCRSLTQEITHLASIRTCESAIPNVNMSSSVPLAAAALRESVIPLVSFQAER